MIAHAAKRVPGWRRRGRRAGGAAAASRDPGAQAEARGLRKARLTREAVEYAITVGILAIFLKPLAWVIGILWGISLCRGFAKQMLEPDLRVEREVDRELERQVPARRRAIAGEHTRRLEELSASIAHEIRNPITAAKSLVQQMGEDPASRSNVEYAGIALEELDRVERSIAHLLRFAREEELQLTELRIGEVIESAVESFSDRFAREGVALETQLDPTGPLRGDPEKLRRVLINLLSNALDALREAGTTTPSIRIEAGENLAGSEVWVRLRDNGPGIETERLSRIFSPFHTSKPAGTGLGLPIAKKLIDAHGGTLEVQSAPGAGTEFLLTLPKHGAGDEA